jgi:hypothetical protein
LGQYLNPLFLNPDQASGQLDVTAIRCDRLPLGQLMYDPKNDGYAEFSISVQSLRTGLKGAQWLLAAIKLSPRQGESEINTDIKDARVVIAKGICTQKATMQIGGFDMNFDGQMQLATSYFDHMTVGVPSSAVAGIVGSQATQYLPNTVGLQFSGPASSLKLNPKTATDLVQQAAQKQLQSGLLGGLTGNKQTGGQQQQQKQNAAGALGGLLQGALGGQQQQQQAAPQPSGANKQQAAPASQPAQPVDALIDLFGKPKKKK